MDIDDTTLHAWFDGELAPDRAAAVEARLRDEPELAARVRLWQADRDALRSRLDAVLHEPLPTRLTQTAQPLALPRRRFAMWAAGLALFLLGGAAGAALWSGLVTPQPQLAGGEWLQRAAVAHAIYAPEKRHPVEVSVEQNQDGHLARWLTRRLDVPVKLFDLTQQGFELVGGRLLPDASGPSAQLMYQQIGDADAAAGDAARPQRVTVYLRRPENGTAAAFRYEQRGELGMFYWVEGARDGRPACGYALVGALPRDRLLALAQAIERQW